MNRKYSFVVAITLFIGSICYFLNGGPYHYATDHTDYKPQSALHSHSAGLSSDDGKGNLQSAERTQSVPPDVNRPHAHRQSVNDIPSPLSKDAATVPKESGLDMLIKLKDEINREKEIKSKNSIAFDQQKAVVVNSPDHPLQTEKEHSVPLNPQNVDLVQRLKNYKQYQNKETKSGDLMDNAAIDTQEFARHLLSKTNTTSRSGLLTGCPPEYKIDGPDAEWFRTSITQRSPLENLTDFRPYVVILTPISNSVRHLQMYFNNLCSLEYPHHLISVVLGEDSSMDRTKEIAMGHVEKLRPYFRRIDFVQLRNFGGLSGSGQNRHAMTYQLVRRKHLAMSRNQLIFSGIRDEKWVLWIDSDVRHVPTNILERLLAINRPIVVPNCLYRRDDGMTDTFDRNTWRETENSKKFVDSLPPQALMLEGYEPTKRKFLNDLKEESDVVKLDSVGGCVLLVEADLHRTGLIFPAFVFDHHIETEGLSKMAAKLEIPIFGLPSVNVIHS